MPKKKFLLVTRKELFYAAVMLRVKKLVNVVYDFPADKIKFERELRDAKRTLSKKHLIEETSSGTNISFILSVCVSFCANAEQCEIINSFGYYATVYKSSRVYMLMEERGYDDLAFAWFNDKDVLHKYVNDEIDEMRGVVKRK